MRSPARCRALVLGREGDLRRRKGCEILATGAPLEEARAGAAQTSAVLGGPQDYQKANPNPGGSVLGSQREVFVLARQIIGRGSKL